MNREYTRFEKARIIGARSIQISMGAPTMLKKEDKGPIDPVDVAIEEFEKGVIPITVIREEKQ
ncbi:MAG: DNA-directed RNA polymerase subunit K [Candidatus Thermoplasmatota archaeon]|nr:DNA-directed RNA polymerase subunit K [Candidatus Thermoplasmatota archaeon]MBS3790312.1 DNA-directed RNA polymerase subunit K [Candidatus Thermoplasmatota archaeon]